MIGGMADEFSAWDTCLHGMRGGPNMSSSLLLSCQRSESDSDFLELAMVQVESIGIKTNLGTLKLMLGEEGVSEVDK